MENWKDYIENKFIPKEQFIFESLKSSNTLRVKHKPTGTNITFFWPSNDWSCIADVQFSNDNTKGWSGEYKEVFFSKEEVKKLDDFLNPVFEKGWISVDTYFFGKYWKSKVYFNSNMRGHSTTYYTQQFGLASILLFPLYAPFAVLFGQKKIVRIKAINTQLQESVNTMPEYQLASLQNA